MRKTALTLMMIVTILLLPLMAQADGILFTFHLSDGRTETMSFAGDVTIRSFEEIVRGNFRCDFDTGHHRKSTLGEIYPNGHTFSITPNTNEAPSSRSVQPSYYVEGGGYSLVPPEYWTAVTDPVGTVSHRTVEEVLSQDFEKAIRDISWSDTRMFQVRLNGNPIDFRVIAAGVKSSFTLALEPSGDGITMKLTVRSSTKALTPRYTKRALEALEELGINNIVIIGGDHQVSYSTSSLKRGVGRK